MKTIRDAVHGDIEFDDHEVGLLDTRAMQRLRGIKQLGLSHLVFPGACHSRFEHSLGTCWRTKQLLEAIHRGGASLSAEDRRVACVAALLHDVTHVPFGHTFEDERRLFDRHDEDEARLDYFLDQPDLREALAHTGVEERVRELLLGRDPGGPFLRQLVAGTVCADLLDYLKRDALYCGLNLDYDERLFRYFHLAEGQLVVELHKAGLFRRDALSELVHLLQMRYALTERVYYHHAKVVAGAMVSRALELTLAAGRFRREELFELRDDAFLYRLESEADRVPGLRGLLEDLATRRLYRRAYFLTLEGFGRPGLSLEQRDALASHYHDDLGQRLELERAIAAELGVSEAEVIVYCPSPRMALKEADVPVRVEPGRITPLSALRHPDVEALKEKHRGLWRFYVLVRRRPEIDAREAGQICAEKIGHPNQLEPQRRGRLHFSPRPLPGSQSTSALP